MLMKNEAKKRGMPGSLTSEMDGYEAVSEDGQPAPKKQGFNRTRELIMERLGGPFDYS